MTDFVTPNWFGHQHAQNQIDFKGHAAAAFEVLSGGYAQKFDPQLGWQQVTGSTAKQQQDGRPRKARGESVAFGNGRAVWSAADRSVGGGSDGESS